MAVALSTIRANSYTTMYSHLQTGTYAISTDNIHPNYTDSQLKSEGMPQVIIDVTVSSMDKITVGRNSPLYQANINYHITVFHSSAANARTLADEVINKIRTGLSVFYAVNLKGFTFDTDEYTKVYYAAKRTAHIYADIPSKTLR